MINPTDQGGNPDMLLIPFLAVAATFLFPESLDSMSIERARNLSGRVVLVKFHSAKPSFTWEGITVLGAMDRPDGAERGAHLKGNRHDADRKTISVLGKLHHINHPGKFIGAEFVKLWVEIRVEEVGK